MDAPVYTARKCRRCNGGGIWRGRGICYDCGGKGIEQIETGHRPLTVDEQAAHDEYQAGIAAREARTAARTAGRVARGRHGHER